MEVILFGGLALLALWTFSRSSDADKPLAQAEPFDSGSGAPLTLALMGVAVLLLLGLMGSAVEGSAYDKVAQTGDAELLSMFSATSLVGVIGGLMVVNGIARGLGIVLMLGGIFLSVAITAGVR